MLVDTAWPQRSMFDADFDVCVIGTGPAGITLARRLGAHGLRTALMEAGDLEWSPESQDIYEGEIGGLDYPPLDTVRLRYFGGTSNHWNGLCRALDPDDFAHRPQHALSGWPIDHEALAPYRAETDRILDVRPREATQRPPRATPRDPFRVVDFGRSPPTRFAEKYHDELAQAENIGLGLHANLVDLQLDETLGQVTAAVFRSYEPGDPGFTVRARAFCLCAGGIENPRLLLNFRSQIPTGIGNEHDLVGRFFCDHPLIAFGEMIFEDISLAASQFIAASEDFLTDQGTLNALIRLDHRPRRPLPLGREILRTVQCTVPFARQLVDAVFGIRPLCNRGGLWDYMQSRDPERYPWARASIVIEQALNPDSRVMLTDDRDAFGMQRVRLDWRLSELDHATLRATGFGFAGHAADVGLGRVRLYDWMLEEPPALPSLQNNGGKYLSYHHMCTTRMSADPRQGVVDADCRVHGMRNLYIGGSSVFATCGYANPTYTIVQLALRLADHLAGTLHT